MSWYFPVLFEFLGHLANNFGSVFTCISGIRSTPLWDCSVDTEQVRGMNSPVQQVNIAIFPIEVNGFSIISFLENSTAERAYSLELRMSWILKSFHHLWRTKIPLATIFGCISLIPLAFFSRSQECPMCILKFWGIFFDLPWGKSTRIFVIFPFQFNVIEHWWHEDYSITECFRCDVLSLWVCLIFSGDFPMLWLLGTIFHS